MVGIIVAVIVALWSVFLNSFSVEVGFLNAAGFLWVWYWIWTVAVGALMVFLTLLVTGALTFKSASAFRSKLAGLAGFAAGGALSLIALIKFAFLRGLLLVGAYLLMTSGTAQMTFAEFSRGKLIAGGILILLGLIFAKLAKNSSKK